MGNKEITKVDIESVSVNADGSIGIRGTAPSEIVAKIKQESRPIGLSVGSFKPINNTTYLVPNEKARNNLINERIDSTVFKINSDKFIEITKKALKDGK